MRRAALWLLPAVAACAVALLAVVDHGLTRKRLNRAEEAAWYCAHLGTRCGAPNPHRIHDAWESRELAYKVTEGLLAVALVFGGARTLQLRRRA